MTIQMVLRSPSMCIPVQFSSFQALQGKDGVGVPAGGKAGQVLKKNSDKDFDTEWEDDVAGQGGTKVTIEGEEVEEFPADVYVGNIVRKLHAELVNNAPEALDTLYELAKALGDDPNFAATVAAHIGGKVSKLNSAHKVYCTVGDGTDGSFSYSQSPNGSTFALRRSGGRLAVSPAESYDEAVPLSQMNTSLEGKLDKSTVANSVYGIDSTGMHYNFSISQNWAAPGSMVLRRSGGRIATGTATEGIDAVPLAQLNEMLAEQVGDIATALDELHAYAQALVNGGATE